MAQLKTIMALILISVTLLISTTPASSHTAYEYLLFTQQWPKSVCHYITCPNPPPAVFTVHGLWPSNYSVYSLRCSGAAFSQAVMNRNPALKANLEQHSWPDVERGQHMRFWGYEWQKHGQCSENVFPQIQYFQWCHTSWENQVIGEMLARASITPRVAPYPLTDIESAIKKNTSCDPLIHCHPKHADLFLEVVICFDHDGNNIVNCQGNQAPTQTNCAASVLYPN